jgi:hypothetical protein
VHSQESSDQDDDDHDADDVENIHWALREGMRDFGLKCGASGANASVEHKFHILLGHHRLSRRRRPDAARTYMQSL